MTWFNRFIQAYYKSIFAAPREIHYFLLCLVLLLVLVPFSKMINVKRRATHTLSCLCALIAAFALLIKSVPAIRYIASDKKRPYQTEAVKLYTISIWNAVALVAYFLQLSLLLVVFRDKKLIHYKRQ